MGIDWRFDMPTVTMRDPKRILGMLEFTVREQHWIFLKSRSIR
jgi:hypothetical protein